MPIVTEIVILEAGKVAGLKDTVPCQEVMEVATVDLGETAFNMGKELKLPLMEVSGMMANGSTVNQAFSQATSPSARSGKGLPNVHPRILSVPRPLVDEYQRNQEERYCRRVLKPNFSMIINNHLVTVFSKSMFFILVATVNYR